MKQVKDFMNVNVITVSPDDTIFEAAKSLAKSNIAGAPVLEEGKIVGIISISDIIKFIDIKLGKLPKLEFPGISWLLLAFLQMQKMRVDMRRELEKATKSKVRDVMTKNVITISPTATIVEAAELMEKHDVNRLPVVSEGKLVGIVARADLIRALVD
jgi:CBS domain-containing protein